MVVIPPKRASMMTRALSHHHLQDTISKSRHSLLRRLA